MTSILSGFDTVQQALAAQQFALAVTQRNVANANNPSYTRQVAVFESDNPEGANSGVAGVYIQSARNRYLDYSISQELQGFGEQSVMYDALQQIDAIFSSTAGQGLQQALSDFFNSFSSLSTAPENLTLRQQVLSAADALCTEFRRLYSGIQQVQTAQDRELSATVDEINSITARIADLNARIASAEGANSDDQFALRDSRQQLLEQLSGLTDISYFETESGSVTVTTRQGGVLVVGNENRGLELASLPGTNFMGIQLDGADITGAVSSGKLGGLLKIRDSYTASYLNTLDDMAAGIISRVNAQHAAGADLDGLAGGDFFAPFTQLISGSNTGAARSMSVALDDPRKIAAAAMAAGVGSNQNSNLMAAIKDETLFSGGTATSSQFYAGLLYRIGSDEKTAEDESTVQSSVLDQLKNQRDAFSGVNLDEEAVNIIKYQKAYEASARYAKVLDGLSEEIINLLGV